MPTSPAPDTVLKRDRVVVFLALAGITAVAWAYMVHEARGMGMGACCRMIAPDTDRWSIRTLPPLALMWTEMMVAMMIPSAMPMILTFAAVNRTRQEQERPFISTGYFLAGYLLVWTAFSVVVAIVQWFLHARMLLSPMMTGNSPVLGGALLVAAGFFQWTRFKNTCLTHCRSPLGFLMTDWREGKFGAMMMGLKHGAYCTGCCWILMSLLFVGGVMNVLWIAALTIFVLLEKVLPGGPWLGKVAGGILVAWGLAVLARAF
jgi:predicted metal-binding membrane protein